MYKRILVALDGSELAERILPHVRALAERFGSAVTLVRATTPVATIIAQAGVGAEPAVVTAIDPDQLVESERTEAAGYLESLAERLRRQGLDVACQQSEGSPADVILEHARSLPAELVALTTHGRGGIGRMVFGSVAEEVLRSAPCPVLLVRIEQS